MQQIPPTQAALEEHAKRAVYQDGHILGKKLLPDPVLPSPTDWGGLRQKEPRVVAETSTGARRLHFSAQVSASMRENVPVDSHILKH